jgi:hypothetical protein
MMISLMGCSPFRGNGSDCPSTGARSPHRAASATAPIEPVDEALWVTDGSGTLRAFDGRTNRVSARVEVGRPAEFGDGLLAGAGLVWVYQYETGRITLVDPRAARVVRRATVPPARPAMDIRLYVAHRALWIAQPGTLWRVAPNGAKIKITLPLGFVPSAMTATTRWLWLAGGARLMRVPPTGRTAPPGSVVPDLTGIQDLLGTSHGLYASGGNQSTVWTLDPDTGLVRTVAHLPGRELVMDLIDAGAHTWAVGNCGGLVNVTGGGRRAPVSDVSQHLPTAATLGSLWVCDEVDSEVVRIDQRTGRVVARTPFSAADADDPAFAVVTGRRSVWVIDTNLADGISRVDPATNRIVRLTRSNGVSTGVSGVVAAPPGPQA